jgi:tetratricopeptide (TPR) repeat protein
MPGRIEKTVFISYRRTNFWTALAVFQNLHSNGYDVFFDYKSIPSGDFEQVITENIRSRAHFIVVLSPSALDRCNEPGDWLRREIEIALENRRNIIPLMMEGFDFGSPPTIKTLTGNLLELKRYNGLSIPAEYFEEAMMKLRSERFLNRALEVVSHPVSEITTQITEEQKSAAIEAPPVVEDQLTAQEWLERGYILQAAKNLNEAIRCYSESIRLKPDFVEAYRNRSTARSENGDLDGAITDYFESIRLNPDEVPEPGQLPLGSHLPSRRSIVFTGREAELRALARALIQDPNSTVETLTQTLVGMNGIGKTQLAIEFCFRYGKLFKGVHWMDGSQALEGEVAACGEKMHLDNWPENTAEQVESTLKVWQRDPRRLIVLDNLDDQEVFRSWKHKLEGMSILVTSENRSWDNNLAPIQIINIFAREEGIALLRKLSPHLEKFSDNNVDVLVTKLDHSPLALSLVGHYLKIHPISPQQYIEKLGADLVKIDLETIFLLSWDKLTDRDVDKWAKTFFITTSFLAPNIPIPRDLYYAMIAAETSDTSDLADDAIWRLEQFGLLSNNLSIHPLLAEFGRAQETANIILRELTEKVDHLSGQYMNTELPAQFMELRPHVEALVSFADRENVDKAGELWDKLGMYYYLMGEYRKAYSMFERCLILLERPAMTNATDRILGMVSSLTNMGEMLRNMGDSHRAIDKYERALEIGEKVLGEEHEFIMVCINNLGLSLREIGELQRAKGIHERSVEIGERVFGKEHQNVATWINNLGADLLDMGDLEGAKVLFERALTTDMKTLGQTPSSSVATRLGNLARVLQRMGDLPSAKDLFERALEIDQQVYKERPNHPFIGIDLMNLADVLANLGELPRAKLLAQQALSIMEQSLLPEHANIKKTQKILEEIEQKMKPL